MPEIVFALPFFLRAEITTPCLTTRLVMTVVFSGSLKNKKRLFYHQKTSVFIT
ncbi:MAG: hypothetical protein II131_03095 [Neisseriaceae bacterium]|nr:hypothetical protein [Neisseriaceae bacterium]